MYEAITEYRNLYLSQIWSDSRVHAWNYSQYCLCATCFPDSIASLCNNFTEMVLSPILSKKTLRPRELKCLAKGSLVAQMVKCLPAMRETWVWSLGWEDLREKEMASHSSTLAWKIPWMEGPGSSQVMGLQRVEHDSLSTRSLSW